MSDFLEFPIEWTVYDNVPTKVFSRVFPTNSYARIYCQATAVRTSNGDNRTFYRTLTILRGGGVPSISSVTDVHAPLGTGGAAAWDLTFVLDGNEIQMMVTGQNAATIMWMIKISVLFLREEV